MKRQEKRNEANKSSTKGCGKEGKGGKVKEK
jgi:hypothetical protein